MEEFVQLPGGKMIEITSGAEVAAEAARLRAILDKLMPLVLCVKRKNTPEFMVQLAERINETLAAMGDGTRVRWPGSWSNEFHYSCGAFEANSEEP